MQRGRGRDWVTILEAAGKVPVPVPPNWAARARMPSKRQGQGQGRGQGRGAQTHWQLSWCDAVESVLHHIEQGPSSTVPITPRPPPLLHRQGRIRPAPSRSSRCTRCRSLARSTAAASCDYPSRPQSTCLRQPPQVQSTSRLWQPIPRPLRDSRARCLPWLPLL